MDSGQTDGMGMGTLVRMGSGCANLLRPIDHGHEEKSVDASFSLVDKVFQSQLFGDLRTDLEERGEQTHELPKAAQVTLLVRVLLQSNVASLAVGTHHLPVTQAAGLCEWRKEMWEVRERWETELMSGVGDMN